MSPLDVLRAARALIAEPERWTQGEYAVDAEGRRVPALAPEALRFCAVGACERAGCKPLAGAGVIHALVTALPAGQRSRITDFNDAHEHSEVLALFDRAIAAEAANDGRGAGR